MAEQIPTNDELAALPAGSVVRGPGGRTFTKTRFDDWMMAGWYGYLAPSGVSANLPDLTVLYHPDQHRRNLWALVDAWDEGYAAGLTPPCNANPYLAAARAAHNEAQR